MKRMNRVYRCKVFMNILRRGTYCKL
jgi:hypothetical protein